MKAPLSPITVCENRLFMRGACPPGYKAFGFSATPHTGLRPVTPRLSWQLFSSITLSLLLTLASCGSRLPPQAEFAMTTVCVVNLFEDGSRKLYSEIFSRIREIDRTMTAFPPADGIGFASEVVEIGRNAGFRPVKIGDDLIEVLERSLHFAELSDGAFDPTIGPLTSLWGFGTDSRRVPSRPEIESALALVNWRDLVVNRAAGTAYLRREGMSLDLGAIAKGYAGDEAARVARQGGARRAIIDLGGNIVLVGWRQRGGNALQRLFAMRVMEYLPWRVGVQNPLAERGEHIGLLELHDTSIVTSGVYEQYFDAPGHDGTTRRFHHLLSTQTGFPIDNGLVSVTVVTESSTDADALSLAAFAMGYRRGRALIDSRPEAEAIFVFADRSVSITDGLVGVFRLTSTDFSLAR